MIKRNEGACNHHLSPPFLHLHFASSPLDSVSDDRTCQRETNVLPLDVLAQIFFRRRVALPRASDFTLASLRTDLSFGRVKAKRRHVVSFALRPAEFASGHVWTDRTAPSVLSPGPNRGPYAASSGLNLRSYRDRRSAIGVLLLRPNRGLYAASSELKLRSYRDRHSAPCVCRGQP
jgi:hypothetical protein